jgi:hypothetical protein
MNNTTLVKIAGGFSFFFFLFHVPFYWMLDWEHTLSCLSRDNWAIVMCFNIISIVLLFLFGFVSMFQTKDIVNTRLGRSFLVYASWFYLFRIIAEFIFFQEPNKVFSAIIILLCSVPGIFYAIPLFRKKQ